jgi:cytochrome c553
MHIMCRNQGYRTGQKGRGGQGMRVIGWLQLRFAARSFSAPARRIGLHDLPHDYKGGRAVSLRTKKKNLIAAIGLVLAGGVGVTARGADMPPPWAWGFTTPLGSPSGATISLPNAVVAAPVPGDIKHNVPGSKFWFTRAEANSPYAPADWFPADHPPMPDIVAHGRESAKPQIYACGYCHLPNGKGRPENANLTGLPYDYIVQQIEDFRNGARRTSDLRKTNTALMEGYARAMTNEEIKAAAGYYSSIPGTPWTKVVESSTVPKTRPSGGVLLTVEGSGAGMEPLGDRIVETPLNAGDFEDWRNPRSGFIAYVPPGSLRKGKILVTAGANKSTRCTACHGADLRGLGPIPPLAGRSPSYMVRQLFDMQHGNRAGSWTPRMAPVIADFSNDDLLVIAAYLASLDP